MSERPNVFDDARYSDDDPSNYRGGEVFSRGDELGTAAGGRQLNVRAYELPAGVSLCPYHYEYVEEWLLVLTGSLALRTPAGVEQLNAGALVCFPPGPSGAHKVTAPADAERPTRLMMFSDSTEPYVTVYPDTNKIGVGVPGGADNIFISRPERRVDYYDGEG